MDLRKSGILLHISSLPSQFGIGDLGPEACRFVDFLKETQQSLWQVLPLNPTDPICGNSPYSSPSAFAANTLLISPALLVEDGLLTQKDLEDKPLFPEGKVHYEAVSVYKERLFQKAHSRLKDHKALLKEFAAFREKNAFWLKDYALFTVIKDSLNRVIWTTWPDGLKKGDQKALEDIEKRFGNQIGGVEFLQYIFFRQWDKFKSYCHQNGVQLIGDIPIYVNEDSADVWRHPGIFRLDKDGRPLAVAGVPPDYFSKTGQRWGNPVYDWKRLKETGYAWWIDRLKNNLRLFDIVRIDHFRGFVQYWEIPYDKPLATHGRWADVSTQDFFDALKRRFGPIPLIAEDLGIITDDVREVMRRQGFPGMKILLFAFGGDLEKHPYLPHNYEPNCVTYTGTHDNNTVQGWFQSEATATEKKNFFDYVGKNVAVQDVHWKFIEMAMTSKADTVIFPMQDVLGLGEEARMNTPATLSGNWQWRLSSDSVDQTIIQRLSRLTKGSRRI
ncbi:MAG: 4-alpha-glucanotransferase [Omnitrophica WOR_2 bacterium RIFCSPHIGHO2_02_FULL_50_17]|nr:MAG: 4-alpha-glucanotransferase [Omnitrophica WOR_2 bacterium RIFCSPHIGHO2_02_FULL_50_17]